MAIVTKPNLFTPSTTIYSAEVNENFDTLYNDYNGNITNANISAAAGIVGTKVDLSSVGPIGSVSPSSGSFTTISADTMNLGGLVVAEYSYPIGSIFISVSSANPNTTLGFGTWSAFAAGRVLVGHSSSDGDFASGTTGGAKTHTLTEAEMPRHRHSYTNSESNFSKSSIIRTAPDAGLTGYTNYAGSDNAHNNLQPYIAVYMWQRTA
jgi:hypothetical protein